MVDNPHNNNNNNNNILFISTWINHPEFIPIQRDLIRKFCKEDHELLVVLDGKETPDFTNFGDISIRQQQIDICKKHNISYIGVPPELHEEPARRSLFSTSNYDTSYRDTRFDPSSRTAVSNQFGWRTFHQFLKPHYRYLVMIQSDIFPFSPFSVRDMLAGNSLLYKDQFRDPIHYAWDGFLFFDWDKIDRSVSTLWNFENGLQNGVFTDTGGGTWTVLSHITSKLSIDAKNSLQWTIHDPFLNTLPLPLQEFIRHDVRNEGEKIFAEIKHYKFVHLRGGGNWEFIKNPAEGAVIQEERFTAFKKCCVSLLS